jgi:hypothetical protein
MQIKITYDTPLLTALEEAAPHDQLSLVYENSEDHFAAAIPFIRIGLDRGEKCVYIADDGSEAVVRDAMHAQNIDVERAIATPQARAGDEGWHVSETRKLRSGMDAHVLEGSDG